MGNAVAHDEFVVQDQIMVPVIQKQPIIDRETNLAYHALLDEIPQELLVHIFSYLSHSSILRMCCLDFRMSKLMETQTLLWGTTSMCVDITMLRSEWLLEFGIESIWNPKRVRRPDVTC